MRRMMWRLVCKLNALGSRISFIPASMGNWLPFCRLQGWQQATRFSQVEAPPRERGTTWSRVSSLEGRTSPQYWQVLRSRSRMFLRESARVWCGMRRYSRSRITEGTRIARRAIVLVLKGVAMTEEENGHFLHAARRAAQTLIGSYDAFNTSTGAC